MERLTEKIINKETREVLAYRILPNVTNLKAIQQLGRYEDIGFTVEELQELIEKNTPQKLNEICGAFGEKYECPNCGSPLNDIDALAGYCKWCGQRVEV